MNKGLLRGVRLGAAAVVTMGLVVAIAGCTSLSGYDSKDSFSCKAPDGVLCASMTGIYANAQQNNLPGQNVHKPVSSTSMPDGDTSASPANGRSDMGTAMTNPLSSGTPIRSAPRILRMWFAPWEDSDGDLHDQSYVYLQVDSGKWLIEHSRRRIQDAYRPVRAPSNSTQEPVRNTPGSNVSGTNGGMNAGQSALARASLPNMTTGTPIATNAQAAGNAAAPASPDFNDRNTGVAEQMKAELFKSLRQEAPAGATCDGNICTLPVKE